LKIRTWGLKNENMGVLKIKTWGFKNKNLGF
jgi:hypothetical protein